MTGIPVPRVTNLLQAKKVTKLVSLVMKFEESKIYRLLLDLAATWFLYPKIQQAFPLQPNMISSIKRLTIQDRDNIMYPKRKKKEELLWVDRTDSQHSIQIKLDYLGLVLTSGFDQAVPTSLSLKLLECRISPPTIS